MYVSSDPGTYMVRIRFTFKTGCDRYHCCYNFKVMKLSSSAAAVWWVMERVVARDGLELCIGTALIISDCYVNVCTKFYAATGGGPPDRT